MRTITTKFLENPTPNHEDATMNIVSKTPMSSVTLPAQDDPYAEVAMEGGGQFGKILKYVKGQWWHDETEVSLGTEFVALMHEAM